MTNPPSSFLIKTHPDPHGRYCAGMFDGQCKWHRGRAVGGTTNINGMFHVRGKYDMVHMYETCTPTG